MRKKIFLSAAILAAVVSAYAQGNGQAGITEATNLITGYFDPGTKLVYAIGAVCGLIGGVKVYNKFSSGDPDTSKTAASWFGACIFLIVAATILRSFFTRFPPHLHSASPKKWPISVHLSFVFLLFVYQKSTRNALESFGFQGVFTFPAPVLSTKRLP